MFRSNAPWNKVQTDNIERVFVSFMYHIRLTLPQDPHLHLKYPDIVNHYL